MIKTENTAEKKENAADTCAAECAAEIKAGIRKQMRAMRRALDAEAVREASFAVAEKVRALPEFNSAGELRLFRNMAGPLGFPRRKCGELQSISPLKCSTESGRAGLRRRRETACVPEHGVWPADIFESKTL